LSLYWKTVSSRSEGYPKPFPNREDTLLIGCAGSAYRGFAGILYVYYVQAGCFDTNLTPTHSLSAGLSSGRILRTS
jgi:hypothetical protein